ncbi:MAG: DEAD/DEAH box helicase, partial [Candidatus Heimdallarchaeota archaeon]|nr:DEAD/DEAH box helicase [Candidatus Heimdallarchaeota archaeon]
MTSVFAQLQSSIQSLLDSQKITSPTEPQEKAIPTILKGNNVLLIAPTGHGKTEAALLPVFHQFLHHQQDISSKHKNTGFSILYITPLRALNRDMLRRTFSWGKQLGISISVRHGDTSKSERARQSRQPPDMLITTPETFQILFVGSRLRQYLHNVRWVIVDEIHELAHDERGAQLAVGLERLEEITHAAGHGFQRIGLSATVGASKEVSRFLGGLSNQSFRDVDVVEINALKDTQIQVELPKVTQEDHEMGIKLTMEPMSFASLKRSEEFISSHVSTLLFINTRDGAEILASRFHLWKPDFPVGVHHGSLSKHARIEAEDQFKDAILKSLICTSSLELGIDVGDTDFIIQYNSPREVTRIVQR